ncbi:hypothetical protein ACF059_27245 [Streptomyces sp. NPDC016562]|uniref:hypothetical protein n=1 Tax=Streptomyces sp. NPDC016562 TaxID=3364966 RepID=UPI0036F4C231
MSFGDPHNPYGQQPPQGQPGYGYPQQAPQGVPPQGGYAYPQQAYPAAPAGYPGSPVVEMPGGVKAARVILFILGGLQALGSVVWIIGGALLASYFTSDTRGSYRSDADEVATFAGIVLVIVIAVSVAFALWAILTAAKLSKGRGGVRASGIVYGSLLTLAGVGTVISNLVALSAASAASSSSADMPAAAIAVSVAFALVPLGLGLWIVVGLSNSAASAYFQRPRY